MNFFCFERLRCNILEALFYSILQKYYKNNISISINVNF